MVDSEERGEDEEFSLLFIELASKPTSDLTDESESGNGALGNADSSFLDEFSDSATESLAETELLVTEEEEEEEEKEDKEETEELPAFI